MDRDVGRPHKSDRISNSERRVRLEDDCAEADYCQSIASIVGGITPNQVLQVFDTYKMLALHDVALQDKTKGYATLYMPRFCSFRIQPTTHKYAVHGIQIRPAAHAFDRDKSMISSAYFGNTDPLVDHYKSQFGDAFAARLEEAYKRDEVE